MLYCIDIHTISYHAKQTISINNCGGFKTWNSGSLRGCVCGCGGGGAVIAGLLRYWNFVNKHKPKWCTWTSKDNGEISLPSIPSRLVLCSPKWLNHYPKSFEKTAIALHDFDMHFFNIYSLGQELKILKIFSKTRVLLRLSVWTDDDRHEEMYVCGSWDQELRSCE